MQQSWGQGQAMAFTVASPVESFLNAHMVEPGEPSGYMRKLDKFDSPNKINEKDPSRPSQALTTPGTTPTTNQAYGHRTCQTLHAKPPNLCIRRHATPARRGRYGAVCCAFNYWRL